MEESGNNRERTGQWLKKDREKREGERNIGMLCYLYTEMKESL